MKTTIQYAISLLGITAGLFFLSPTAQREGSPASGAIVASTTPELASVFGRQDPVPVTPVLEEGKCCGTGSACTPRNPTVVGGVACVKAASGGCVDAVEDKPCYGWSGPAVRNGACVTPPAGFVGPAFCAMDTRDFPCRRYRTGVCDSTGFWGYDDCVCDVDSAEQWADGQKRCAQGSTTCTPSTI